MQQMETLPAGLKAGAGDGKCGACQRRSWCLDTSTLQEQQQQQLLQHAGLCSNSAAPAPLTEQATGACAGL
jgi:hypothetical protein